MEKFFVKKLLGRVLSHKLVIKLIDGEEKRIKKLEKKKNILSIFKDLFGSLWIMFTLPFRSIFGNLGIS